MIMQARVIAGWITEADLASQQSEAAGTRRRTTGLGRCLAHARFG